MGPAKRVILILLSILLIAGAVTPWLCGRMIQRQIDAGLQEMRSWLDNKGLEQLRVEVESKPGWLSSDYRFILKWQQSDDLILVDNHIYHGPFPWSRIRKQQWLPQLAEIHSAVTFEQSSWPFVMPRLDFEQLVDFAGNVDINWHFLGYLNKHVDGKLDVASSQGNIQYLIAEKRFEGQLQIPDLRLRTSGTRLQLTDFSVDFEFSKVRSVLPVGNARIRWQRGRFRQGSHDFQIEGLDGNLVSSDFERTNNLQFLANCERFASDAFSSANNQWDVILRGISSSGLEALIPNQHATDLPAYMSYVMGAAEERLPQLLSRTELEIASFESTLSDGTVRGFLRTNVPALQEIEGFKPIDLLPAINLSAELALPKQLVNSLLKDASAEDKFHLSDKYKYLKKRIKQSDLDALAENAADQQLSIIVAQGLLREEGEQYYTSIELNQGELFFNGYRVHGFQAPSP